jgi:hypothetical protein
MAKAKTFHECKLERMKVKQIPCEACNLRPYQPNTSYLSFNWLIDRRGQPPCRYCNGSGYVLVTRDIYRQWIAAMVEYDIKHKRNMYYSHKIYRDMQEYRRSRMIPSLDSRLKK